MQSRNLFEVDGKSITRKKIVEASNHPERFEFRLSSHARMKMQSSRDYLNNRILGGEMMYGVNTGFGSLSSIRISDTEIEQLQKNIIRSHSAGVGNILPLNITRAIMILRANALASGLSGIRPEVVDKILEFLNNNIIPAIPEQGSVGASGDLAPLSHLALALIGEGRAWDNDKITDVSLLISKKNIQPLHLQAKEGLALINGCQVMTGIGFIHLDSAVKRLELLDVAGALSLEALMGSRGPFDALISQNRPHPGEILTAQILRKILGDSSPLADSHTDCDRVQDAYSLRCMPAVHGAAKDAIQNAIKTLEIEANSSTDNPLVFSDEGKILSCGNFHGEPVAFQFDFAGIALSAAANISECRIEKMINPSMNYGLPPFLAKKPGLNSGMMVVEIAAASLVSENKILAHPASVDSIPTSADKEDHVSMGTIGARKLGQILSNFEKILAMEFLCNAQALDLRRPLKTNHFLEGIHSVIRKYVPFAEEDRVFSYDLEKMIELITSEELNLFVEKNFGGPLYDPTH